MSDHPTARDQVKDRGFRPKRPTVSRPLPRERGCEPASASGARRDAALRRSDSDRPSRLAERVVLDDRAPVRAPSRGQPCGSGGRARTRRGPERAPVQVVGGECRCRRRRRVGACVCLRGRDHLRASGRRRVRPAEGDGWSLLRRAEGCDVLGEPFDEPSGRCAHRGHRATTQARRDVRCRRDDGRLGINGHSARIGACRRRSAWLRELPGFGSGFFPSGHSAAALALTLAAIIATPDRWRVAAAVSGAVAAGLLGIGNLVTHSHHPSDVVGGYLLAAAWGAAGHRELAFNSWTNCQAGGAGGVRRARCRACHPGDHRGGIRAGTARSRGGGWQLRRCCCRHRVQRHGDCRQLRRAHYHDRRHRRPPVSTRPPGPSTAR